jgi:hypothetical protein
MEPSTMKKQTIIISLIVIFVIIIANIGDLRCQENSNIIAENNQLNHMGRFTNKINEDNLMDDKDIVVEILGQIIQHNLFNECQKIDSEELEDRLERSR